MVFYGLSVGYKLIIREEGHRWRTTQELDDGHGRDSDFRHTRLLDVFVRSVNGHGSRAETDSHTAERSEEQYFGRQISQDWVDEAQERRLGFYRSEIFLELVSCKPLAELLRKTQ